MFAALLPRRCCLLYLTCLGCQLVFCIPCFFLAGSLTAPLLPYLSILYRLGLRASSAFCCPVAFFFLSPGPLVSARPSNKVNTTLPLGKVQ